MDILVPSKLDRVGTFGWSTFNAIKSLYTKNNSEWAIFCQPILLSIFYDIIATKMIYFSISNAVGWIYFDRKPKISKCINYNNIGTLKVSVPTNNTFKI